MSCGHNHLVKPPRWDGWQCIACHWMLTVDQIWPRMQGNENDYQAAQRIMRAL